jgi:uncharacterized protein YndB with AHSA1/START domain
MDFQPYLGKVTHTVTAEARGRRVTLERTYDTSAEDLWDAVTNPERLPRWFLPISGDLKLGGRYQFQGNAGGTITQCEPPAFVAVTWEFGGQTSWVEVRIASEGAEKARLSLSHICPVDDHWKTYGAGATGVGWDLGLLGLALHLENPAAERMSEDAFFGSDAGKAYIVAVSKDWLRAAMAGGEDRAQAEAAEKATTAFYTGAPQA